MKANLISCLGFSRNFQYYNDVENSQNIFQNNIIRYVRRRKWVEAQILSLLMHKNLKSKEKNLSTQIFFFHLVFSSKAETETAHNEMKEHEEVKSSASIVSNTVGKLEKCKIE